MCNIKHLFVCVKYAEVRFKVRLKNEISVLLPISISNYTISIITERYCHIQSILNIVSPTLRHMPNTIDPSLDVEILEKSRSINRSDDKVESINEAADCRNN